MAKTTLVQRINQLVDFTALQFKAVFAKVGVLENLTTSHKADLVGAVNEVKAAVGAAANGAPIDDAAAAADKVYSSMKTDSLIADLRAELLDGAPEALDTLREIAEYIVQDKSAGVALVEALAGRLKLDEPQELTPTQKSAVEATLNLGDTDTDFVARFESALK